MKVRIIPTVLALAAAIGFGTAGINLPTYGHPISSMLASGGCGDVGGAAGDGCGPDPNTHGADGYNENPHGNSMMEPGSHYEGSKSSTDGS
jgi:hypothetical protein